MNFRTMVETAEAIPGLKQAVLTASIKDQLNNLPYDLTPVMTHFRLHDIAIADIKRIRSSNKDYENVAVEDVVHICYGYLYPHRTV